MSIHAKPEARSSADQTHISSNIDYLSLEQVTYIFSTLVSQQSGEVVAS